MAIRKRVDLPTKKEIDATVNKIARRTVLDTLSSAVRNQFSDGKLTIRHLTDKGTYALKLSIIHTATQKVLYARHVLNLTAYQMTAHEDYATNHAGKLLGASVARKMRKYVQNNVLPEATRVSNVVKLVPPEDFLIFDEASLLTSMTYKKNKKPAKKPTNDSIYPPWGEK